MATEKSSAPARPSAEDHDQDHQHACYEGVVYIGHLVVDDDGEEVEVVEAVPPVQGRRRVLEKREEKMAKLERTTFEVSRASEYFDARQLSALTGVPQTEFASVCLKELVDNSLDACETSGVEPEIGIDVGSSEDAISLTVSDNGPGIPPEVVHRILDYSVRVSDKAAYRSPTRGAQGNALKTVIGIPYSLGSREPLIVKAQGVRHSVAPWVDPAGVVHFDYTSTPEHMEGTTVSLKMPARVRSADEYGYYYVQEFDSLHWARSFAAFNPHATISYQANEANGGDTEGREIYKCTLEGEIKKYVPSQPTSPHWYSADSLKGLIFNHVAHARAGGRDLPLGEFVRQFAGLSSTKKAREVANPLMACGYTHLSSFKEKPEMVGELLEAMLRCSKPPKASALGWVGQDHFQTFFENVYQEIKEYKYVKRTGTMPSGLPFTFEFALAVLDGPGHLYCGINFSPTFGDPLQGTTLAGPKFKASGIQGFLSEGHALPKTESAWYLTPASVAVAAHIITPAPLFLDRGKTRLDMEGA
jgi:DNA topoisomerase VI subunit B